MEECSIKYKRLDFGKEIEYTMAMPYVLIKNLLGVLIVTGAYDIVVERRAECLFNLN